MVEKGKNMKIDGFIEVKAGIWYRESDGKPFSSKVAVGKAGNYRYDGPLRELKCKNDKGYYIVRINKQCKSWHRLVFEYFNGVIPKGLHIDHINNIRSDNRTENLRCVTPETNNNKRLVNRNNKIGIPGVYWRCKISKWCVQITISKRSCHFGSFSDPYEAYKIFLKKKIELFGEESITHYPTLEQAKKIASRLSQDLHHQTPRQ